MGRDRAQAFGGHHTGDIGIKDADSYVYLIHRTCELDHLGVFNICRAAIEKTMVV